MSEAKHTPGPWQYYCDQSDHFVHKVRVGASLVCQMPGWRINSDLQKEQEANARLIAAAPELLEALSDLLASISGGEKSCGHAFTCVCPGDKSSAAIAKATGGQP